MKKNLILQQYFKELSLNFYFKKIISFDLILKVPTISFYQLNLFLSNYNVTIKINITQRINLLNELNDSLWLLFKLTKQSKSLVLYNNKLNKYLLYLNITNKNNYYYFLYLFIYYYYPFFNLKVKKNKIKINNIYSKNKFTFSNFSIIFDNKYDFFENIFILFFFNFKFNINNFFNYLYLTSLKILL